MSSKFISMSISHLVANDPKIPASNVIQEVQVLFQTGFCRENGTRDNNYVPDIYSREMYKRTYESNFHPAGHKNFCRDAPYNLTFYPPNMNNERDRKQGIGFLGGLDYRNPDSLSSVTDVICWDIIEKIVITPIQTMYKFVS
ncbi:hypothetical protein M9H77_07102 [Catharanthus roseus]|uniref:Uncharacterized protein n=1 Tax=Catharanthus roseus TaxID=4058 RepID=A0ACC0BU83_CATRO|nr:hypothetical protein M9H77_07102 [Catharanthus roseus]